MPLALVVMARGTRLGRQCSETGGPRLSGRQLLAQQTARAPEPTGDTSPVSPKYRSSQLLHEQVLVSANKMGSLLLLRVSVFTGCRGLGNLDCLIVIN